MKVHRLNHAGKEIAIFTYRVFIVVAVGMCKIIRLQQLLHIAWNEGSINACVSRS